MKVCIKCKIGKNLYEFPKRKNSKDGYRNCCKICQAKYMKQWQQSEKGNISHKKSNRKYRKIHKKQRLVYARAYSKTIKGHLQQVYYAIKQRVGNINHPKYHRYGGRGIKLKFTFNQLFQWCEENSVDPRNLEIDRIDNNGSYELNNIRFIPHKENCNNRYYDS